MMIYIDIKLGLVTKLDKRSKAISKNLMMTSYQKNVTPLSFFRGMANLELSGSRIPDV